MDILPTFCEIIGIKPNDPDLQGHSLLNDILGKPSSIPQDRVLINHAGRWTYPTEMESFKYNASMITNRFRLVWERESKSNKDAKRSLALYNYRTDLGEESNIVNQHPELVEKLQAMYEPWWQAAKKGMVNDLHQLKTGKLVDPRPSQNKRYKKASKKN